MRYFESFFGGSTLFLQFCRRICDNTHCIMSHKDFGYVYSRKRELDKLQMERITGIAPSGDGLPAIVTCLIIYMLPFCWNMLKFR